MADRAAAMGVAIIIPCYNHGRYLAAAIESARAQIPAPGEIIVIDDGSTDDTAAVAAGFSDVVYVYQANAGLSAARNAGLERIKSSHALFLDADDMLLPGALAASLAAFSECPEAAFVYGGYRFVDANRAPIWETLPDAPDDVFEALLERNYIAMHGAVLYDTARLRGVGGFDARLRSCEDYDCYLRLAKDHPVAAYPFVAAEYRQHDGNMSRNVGRMLGTALAVLRRQRDAARKTPAHMAAYRRGRRFWRDYYGDALLNAALAQWRASHSPARTAPLIAAGLQHDRGFIPRLLRHVAGAARRRLVRPRCRPTILMYHRIAEAESDPWRLAVSPDRFDDQLAMLARRRSVLPLDRFAQLHSAGDLPDDALAITFDDGYACNALVAAPLLEARGLPATIFLTTGAISADAEFWWDALERIVLETGAERLRLALPGEETIVYPGPLMHRTELAGWDAMTPRHPRQDAYLSLWSRLRPAAEVDRRAAMAELHAQAGVPPAPRPSYRAMTEDEARALERSGYISVGAHSVSHPALSRLAPEDQSAEIERSRDACQVLTGKIPIAFAYPYGDHDAETVDRVRAAGFAIACTTEAMAVAGESQPLRLPRLAALNWTGAELDEALRGLAA